MFPSDAHLGRVTVGRGSERGGWNGAGKSLLRQQKEVAVMVGFGRGKEGETRKMSSPHRGKPDGARAWPETLRRRTSVVKVGCRGEDGVGLGGGDVEKEGDGTGCGL
uniref:Uncharacterized protein n=1 Tax=Oryza sativa subsp. japonica TaxID=39947 RepID=Q69KP7_ORYSJ|nr:hypothetical protein [Oryza sativa Japonica Group]